ncbi:hypothetical protein SAMN05192535_2847 [Shouchella rhizosphaerae]|nr:hypothetical protein SAMN05192535_2847 [Shouchella rhizosphaerae]
MLVKLASESKVVVHFPNHPPILPSTPVFNKKHIGKIAMPVVLFVLKY